jgi:diguanylate cyclase (GGDEF)-like protein/PAS domain S-box-containing protein
MPFRLLRQWIVSQSNQLSLRSGVVALLCLQTAAVVILTGYLTLRYGQTFDSTQQTQTDTRTPLLLCLVLLLIVVSTGMIMARSMITPILHLNRGAKAMARGELVQTFEVQGFKELRELAVAFNNISRQLQLSFVQLQALNQGLIKSERQLTEFLAALPMGVIVHRVDGSIAYSNPIARSLLGIDTALNADSQSLATMCPLYVAGTGQLCAPEHLPFLQALKGERVAVENLEIHQDGKVIPFEVQANPIFDDQGHVIYAIAVFQDISARQQVAKLQADYNHQLETQVAERTAALVQINAQLEQEIADRQQAEAALSASEAKLSAILQNVVASISQIRFFDDQMIQYEYHSPNCLQVFGYTAEEMLADPNLWKSRILPSDRETVLDKAYKSTFTGQALTVEYRFLHKDGTVRWIADTLNSQRDEATHSWVMTTIAIDITERKQIELELHRAKDAAEAANQELERLARFDALTQVANRRWFDEYLEQEWRRLSREQQPLSLILLDADFFKRYNDIYGHQEGDHCLREIARIMRSSTHRPSDLVARYGGEEFAVILPNTPAAGAAQVGDRIQSGVRQRQLPHRGSQVSQYVTVSLGIATVIPIMAVSPAQLIALADQALYRAKTQGRDRIVVEDI